MWEQEGRLVEETVCVIHSSCRQLGVPNDLANEKMEDSECMGGEILPELYMPAGLIYIIVFCQGVCWLRRCHAGKCFDTGVRSGCILVYGLWKGTGHSMDACAA